MVWLFLIEWIVGWGDYPDWVNCAVGWLYPDGWMKQLMTVTCLDKLTCGMALSWLVTCPVGWLYPDWVTCPVVWLSWSDELSHVDYMVQCRPLLHSLDFSHKWIVQLTIVYGLSSECLLLDLPEKIQVNVMCKIKVRPASRLTSWLIYGMSKLWCFSFIRHH